MNKKAAAGRCTRPGASCSHTGSGRSRRRTRFISRMAMARRGCCACSRARPECLHGPLPLVMRTECCTRSRGWLINSDSDGSGRAPGQAKNYSQVARSELAPRVRPVPPRPDLIAASDWGGFSCHAGFASGSAWRPAASDEKPTNQARGGGRTGTS